MRERKFTYRWTLTRDLHAPNPRKLEELFEQVCARHDLPSWRVKGKETARRFSYARQEFMFRAMLSGVSSTSVGAFLGRDHATVLYGADEHYKRMAGLSERKAA